MTNPELTYILCIGNIEKYDVKATRFTLAENGGVVHIPCPT